MSSIAHDGAGNEVYLARAQAAGGLGRPQLQVSGEGKLLSIGNSGPQTNLTPGGRLRLEYSEPVYTSHVVPAKCDGLELNKPLAANEFVLSALIEQQAEQIANLTKRIEELERAQK